MRRVMRSMDLGRSWQILIILILLLGVIRLAALTLHRPMLGYANNFDMLRVQTFVGLMPRYHGELTREATPDAPIRFYEYTDQVDFRDGYLTSQLLPIYLAMPLSMFRYWYAGNVANQFDVLALGVVSMLMLSAAGILTTIWFGRVHPRWALISALIFTFLVCDPINTLWLNSFYSEYSALLWLYVSVALLLWLLITPETSYRLMILTACALLMLGISKLQHMLLPLGLTVIWLVAARARLRRVAYLTSLALFLTGSLLSIVLQNRQVERTGYMDFARHANATNTYFGAVLPAMSDPNAGIRVLGVPESCAQYVGNNWFAPGMGRDTCPQIASVPRRKLVALTLQDPMMPIRLMRRALELGRPWLVQELGHVEGADHGKLGNAGPMFWTLSSVIAALPLSVFGLLLVVAGATFIHAMAMVLLQGLRRKAVPVEASLAFTALLGVVWVLVPISSIAGDGLIDIPKHFHLAHSLVMIGLGVSTIRLWKLILKLRPGLPAIEQASGKTSSGAL